MPGSKPRCTSILYQEGTYFFILETEYERQWKWYCYNLHYDGSA